MPRPKTVDKNKPDEPGFYIARDRSAEVWHLVIEIKGKRPYLSYHLHDFWSEASKNGVDPDDYWFGPRIEAFDTTPTPGEDERR